MPCLLVVVFLWSNVTLSIIHILIHVMFESVYWTGNNRAVVCCQLVDRARLTIITLAEPEVSCIIHPTLQAD